MTGDCRFERLAIASVKNDSRGRNPAGHLPRPLAPTGT